MVTNNDVPEYEVVQAVRNANLNNKNFKKNIFSTLATIIITVAICAIIALLIFPIEKIDGDNLSPTLNNNDIVLTMRQPSYEKGDLICFGYGELTLCKRIVATGGDYVNFDKDNNLYVNDKKVDEFAYLINRKSGDYENIYPIQVPNESYFVLSDNREVMTDSRTSSIGCIKDDSIIGKVIFRFWPLTEFKLLT